MLFWAQIKKEWRVICSDAWLKALLFWLPLVLAFLLWAIFSAGLARSLMVGVVDLDNSRISRSLTRYYDASPTLKITKHYASVAQSSDDLRSGAIYAVVVIPKSLEKNTLLGLSPQVTVFYNSQYILIGKLINASIMQAHGTYVAGLETLKDLAQGSKKIKQALGDAVPIQQQITPLFNANNHYGQFLVSAAIPAVWQIFIMATIVLALANELRSTTTNAAQKATKVWPQKKVMTSLIAKLLPYILLFWLQGIIFIIGFYSVLAWPMQGSWLVLVLAQLLLVLACTSVACLFFFITLDAARAMSLVAGFAAPAFAFMGITFPTSDMPWLAQLWRNLLPISHYIEIQVKQVNYASSFSSNMNNFIALSIFLLTFFIAIFIVLLRAKNIAKANQKILVPSSSHLKSTESESSAGAIK